MSWFDLGKPDKKVPKRRRATTERLSDDPKILKGQLTRDLVGQSMRHLLREKPDKAAAMGERLMASLLGQDMDPVSIAAAQALENDPEYLNELRELYLEKQRAEIEAKTGRRRRRNGEEGMPPQDDDFAEFGKQLMWDRLQDGGGSKGIGDILAAMLGPGGGIAEIAKIWMMAQMQSQQANGGAVAAPMAVAAVNGHQAPALETGEEEGLEVGAKEPLLMDIFTPAQVQAILTMAETDMPSAGAQAAVLVRQALEKMTPFHRLTTGSTLNTMADMDVQLIIGVILPEYKQYAGWQPVILQIEQHPDVFESFLQELMLALSPEEAEEVKA